MSAAIYLTSAPDMAVTACHIWSRWVIDSKPGCWYVCGMGTFTKSGFACIDNFGNLVEVAR